ncbi:ArsO family NAD(P)H-dependent flavin-containing monooxygenase [Nodularia spumigena CS-584]|uniref:Thioredoxin reductase n=3 Tax=Flavobacterium TaxID=237 RepID=A0A7W7IZP8_9FLAO|nr:MULTISPECIES: ArsO family NAD(P)H-dependent flavin-containing monooxygenase [Flavobacterium]MBB4803546.1 thioredoxin reductase [Flavobacterium nitrogenifigens]MBB6388649.1 thioredoxin reductase [Flavobacterium notoginsengisoli]MDB9381252.1 ArsO family NAD(P)H-dependent flavin-containing monooxygenase [Nodularia spumigena CS-584]OXA95496.1 pyridine nucleotide-disulfide oxidoreductase [Flavobacterium oncorhynchi]
MDKIFDSIIIGGGQSGLACGYYLRRSKLEYLILDKQERCGGAWRNTWDSLTLFSPAQHSSLPGWLMPKSENLFPLKQEVIDYLCQYEQHYQLPIERNVNVNTITSENSIFRISTSKGEYFARTIIAATGTWENPFVPEVKGIATFTGIQIHSAQYKNPEPFKSLKVLVVGEGNSGAQIVAEVSKVAIVKWSTRKPPQYLPDDVDGFYLFNVASAKYNAEKEGKPFDAANYDLGNIVMVPPVKEARSRNTLNSSGKFESLYENGVVWEDGTKEEFDAIIWCTGFGYATSYLKDLVSTDERGIVKTEESRALEVSGLWLAGYGSWTGYASATLIGINRNAKQTVNQISEYLSESKSIVS